MFNLFFALLAFWCMAFGLQAQQVQWGCHSYDWLFLGVPNVLYVEVEGVPFRELSIQSSDGQKVLIKEDGYYQIITKRRQLALSLYRHQGKDSTLLGTKQFEVKALPKPTAHWGRWHQQDTVSKQAFLVNLHHLGINAPLVNYNYNVSFPIKSFTLIVTRNDSLIYLKDIQGARVNNTVKNDLARLLHGGERLFFTSIQFSSPFHYNKMANSIELYIEE